MKTTRNKNPLLPQHPFACQVSGPSKCGKTVLIKELLTHPDSPFNKVIYHYSMWQPLYDEMRAALEGSIEFVKGLPTEPPAFDTSLSHCFIFDDLMHEVDKSPWASKLYTAGCHHQNLSVISLQQKLFTNSDNRLQCHYLIMFDYPLDRSAVLPLARQMCPGPGNADRFFEIYKDATGPDHGWLLVDATKKRDPRLRFRRSWRSCYINATDL